MSIESERDLVALRRVGRTVAVVLQELRAFVRPGMTTAEVDERGGELLARRGAQSAPRRHYRFPGHLCISVNDEAVHGVPGARVITAGDLVKLDLVAEQDGYLADAAITIAVPPVAPVSRQLARCARRAFESALSRIRAGGRIHDVGRAIEAETRRMGFSVIRDLSGHGVGRAIHEEPVIPNFGFPGDQRTLTDGLVIAVEPIIAAGSGRVAEDADGWTVRTTDGGRAAHYEHTLVVTRGQPILLTAA